MTQPLEQLPALNGLPGPGTVIGGKYRVDGVLGSGGMGVVLGATHLELDTAVAIKVVRADLANNEEVIARMLFEARAAAKLRSSHIVRVLDVGRLGDGAPYIVMERLEGSDLATLLTDGCLPVQDAVDYVLQACEGLAEAHATGIIHRDLKPENLFLAETPEGPVLKILDFGISKDIGSLTPSGPRLALTNAGHAVGSPYYMSPEQMRASLQIDARADIWSLGAILFELLTGRCPFEGESLAVVCAKVLGEEAPPLRSLIDDVPAPLEAIVACCLTKDAERRFADVGKLASALRDFASADGKLCADRSARLALGIKSKSERPIRITPTTRLDQSSACSSPTLQSLTSTPVAGHRYVLSSVTEGLVLRRSPRARRIPRLAFAGLAALVVVVIAGTFWSTSIHSRTAAASVDGTQQPRIAAQAALPTAQPAPTVAIAALSAVTIAPAAPPKSKKPTASWQRRAIATPSLARSAAAVQPSSLGSATADARATATQKAATASSATWDSDRLGGRY